MALTPGWAEVYLSGRFIRGLTLRPPAGLAGQEEWQAWVSSAIPLNPSSDPAAPKAVWASLGAVDSVIACALDAPVLSAIESGLRVWRLERVAPLWTLLIDQASNRSGAFWCAHDGDLAHALRWDASEQCVGWETREIDWQDAVRWCRRMALAQGTSATIDAYQWRWPDLLDRLDDAWQRSKG